MNLFERYFCNKFTTVNKIQTNIKQLDREGYSFPENIYNECYAYYKIRYLTNEKTNKLFENLFLGRDVKHQQVLRSTLENPDSKIKEKVLACFIIIYRLRNNLFHGSKNIATLNYQNENFKIANQVIMSFLSFLKSNNKLVELN